MSTLLLLLLVEVMRELHSLSQDFANKLVPVDEIDFWTKLISSIFA